MGVECENGGKQKYLVRRGSKVPLKDIVLLRVYLCYGFANRGDIFHSLIHRYRLAVYSDIVAYLLVDRHREASARDVSLVENRGRHLGAYRLSVATGKADVFYVSLGISKRS